MHEAALHGKAATFWRSLLFRAKERPSPTVKLH
jgi:hypothetical protein